MKKTLKLFLLSVLFILSFSQFCAAKEYSRKIFLWRGVKGMETQLRDTVLYHFDAVKTDSQADSGNKLKTAVIICPGGSYNHLGIKSEGFSTARWFSSKGVEAFVLRYRVGYNEHHYPDQLEDLQMAILYLRKNADQFGIDKNKIGCIGFSAGGHLVTMAGEFAETCNELSKLGIEAEESLRPDFVMPVYPVVTMDDDIGHKWSRKSLLGHVYSGPDADAGFSLLNIRGFKYSQSYKDRFSMEKNVPENMPPVFLLACEDDPVVIFENSVRLDKALTDKNIEHLFVTYPKGGHGFGMQEKSYIIKTWHWNEKDLWPWLKKIGMVD